MTFLSIGFLACGLAAAIPVFIHMIHRQNLRELPFPTLRFIRISEQKTRNKRRIQDILLLLLRMAVLLLIAIGLANPTIRNLSNFWGGAQTSVVIVLDNSASMGQIDGDVPRLETAVATAERILSELGEGDNIGVIIPCGPTFTDNGQLPTSQDKIIKAIREAKVSYEKANLAAAVQHARSLLVKTQTPSKMIFVISDQQIVSWQGLAAAPTSTDTSPTGGGLGEQETANAPLPNPQREETLEPGLRLIESEPSNMTSAEREEMMKIPVVLVNCNQMPKPNVGLVRLDVRNVVPIAHLPVPMTVLLRNTSSLEQTRRFDVFINGMKQYMSDDIKLEPNSERLHPFTIIFDRGGINKGEVRLAGTDGNPFDDKLYFAMDVGQGVPVALIKPMKHEIPLFEDTYFIEKMLSTGPRGVSPFDPRTLLKDELLSEPLQNYSAVICVNLPALERDAAVRLVEYVEKGGNLIWISGDNVVADDYNQLNAELGDKLLPLPLKPIQTPDFDSGRDSWNINTLDGSYPAFRTLVSPREPYTRTLIFKRTPFDMTNSSLPALARMNDDEALIVQRRIGNGTITMLGTAVHGSWSNLPTGKLFLPMIHQLITHLAGIEQTRLQTVAGQPLSFTFKDDDKPSAVEIIPPSGAVLRRELKKMPDGQSSSTFVFEDTDQVGVYLLRPLDAARQTQIPFSVNIDGDELDVATLTEEDAKARFGASPLVYTNVGDQMSSTFDQLKRGTSLWDTFLWTVLLALVFEAFISNRFTQRKDEQEKGIDVRHTLPRKTPSLA